LQCSIKFDFADHPFKRETEAYHHPFYSSMGSTPWVETRFGTES
jgi:hypothetical protein